MFGLTKRPASRFSAVSRRFNFLLHSVRWLPTVDGEVVNDERVLNGGYRSREEAVTAAENWESKLERRSAGVHRVVDEVSYG